MRSAFTVSRLATDFENTHTHIYISLDRPLKNLFGEIRRNSSSILVNFLGKRMGLMVVFKAEVVRKPSVNQLNLRKPRPAAGQLNQRSIQLQ